MRLNKISTIGVLLLILISTVLAYSTYGSPAEFGNETLTTCYIGGDDGIVNCTGNAEFQGNMIAGGNMTADILSGNMDASYIQNDDWIEDSQEGYLNVNGSDHWDNMDSLNATQMEDNGGVLNILESWLTIFINAWFLGKTTDNLTEGSINFYDNQSWNEIQADKNYVNIGGSNMTGPLSTTMSWTNLTDYPVACPEGYAITQLNDSVICTAFVQENNNITFDDLNITGLIYGNGSQLTDIPLQDLTSYAKLDGSNTPFTGDIEINGPTSGTTPFTIKADAGQTAHILDIKDSSGTTLLYFDKYGEIYTSKNQDGTTSFVATNDNAGGKAKAQMVFGNTASGGHYTIIEHLGKGFTTSGIRKAKWSLFTNFEVNGAAGIGFGTYHENPAIMYTHNIERLRIDGTSGDIIINNDLDVGGDANITGNLIVGGNATYNGYYGGMWFHNDAGVPIEWNDSYQTVHFTNATNLNGFSFLDTSILQNTNGNGRYQVHWNAVGTGTNNHIYHGAIFVNEVEQENTIGHAKGDGNGEVRIDSFGFIYLNNGDNVTMRGRDVGSTTSATAILGNLNLVRVGN